MSILEEELFSSIDLFNNPKQTFMKLIKIISIAFLALLAGCSSKAPPPLQLITNAWVGFSPLFYAKEKGWLEEHSIELSTVVSLGESTHIYESVKMDGFTGTQYEYQLLSKRDPTLIPVMMFDRSSGGDVIMSNTSLQALSNISEPIDVYLEINSVNYPLFKDFIRLHQLSDKTFNYINGDQLKIVEALKQQSSMNPSIVVTYDPYDHQLKQQGFQVIASTADNLNLLVVDALFTPEATFRQHRAQFETLKSLVNRAIGELQQDPQHYYQTVKPYLENNNFQEFKTSLQEIEWLNRTLSDKLLERLKQADFPTRDLL